MTVLGLASRVWQQASLAGPAARALTKLKAAGVEPDESSFIGLEPRVRTSEPAFEPLWAAVRDRLPVRFAYRGPARPSPSDRHVEPWAVASWHGRWYLTAYDRDRQAERVFRLSRVGRRGRGRTAGPGRTTSRPVTTRATLLRSIVPDRPQSKAVVRAATGRRSGPAAAGARARATEPATAGWRLVVPYADLQMLAEEITSYGPALVAVEPPELTRGHRAAAAAGGRRGQRRCRGARRPRERGRDRAALPAADDGAVAAHPPGRASCPTRPPSSASTRAQLVKDLELLFVCGTPGHLPGRPDRGRVGGRPGLRRQRREHRPAPASRRRRGARPAGRPAHAGRGARPGGAVGRRPGHGQAGGGRRRGCRGSRRGPRRPRGGGRGRGARRGPAGAGRPPPAAAGLPRAEPGRDHPARRRPDADPDRRGPLVPRGLVPPGRGACGCSGWTGSSASRCSTRTARRRLRPGPGTWTRRCSRPGRTT